MSSTADTIAPKLTSLTIPKTVNLASGTAGLTITGLASDDRSGVKNVLVYFDKNITYSFSLGDGSSYSSNLLGNFGHSDSWADGASSQTWGIAATNSSGTYNVTRVAVEDVQGNTRSYSASELAGMGVNTSILMVANKSVLTSADDSRAGTVYADWLLGVEGNDRLNGLDGDDLLDGGAGNDVLDGGTGSDKLIGGLGNDTYYVDSASDVVSETSGSGGIDTVIASVSRTLGSYQENLILSGTAAINGTGNSLANTLTGNSAANVLNGGVGADTMIGGLGNDTYYVDSASDVVSETFDSGGIDTVIASVNRILGNYQENLTLSGTAALNGSGNSLANTLTGNSAANVLNGGGGDDRLSGGAGNDFLVGGAGKDVFTGGAGNDIFDFNSLSETGLTSSIWDVISDFQQGSDKIDLATLDANTATAANDAFNSIIGSTTSFTAAGQLKVASGVLYGNTDSDSTAEFAIQLVGISSLATSDFVL
jgi:Ca2+-binding RTX toxin-like protein